MLVHLSAARRASVAGGAVAVLVALGAVVGYGGSEPSSLAVLPGITPVGAKRACIYPRQTRSILDQVQQTLGRDYDCVLVYNDEAPDWKGWSTPWFTVHDNPEFDWPGWMKAGTGRQIVIGQSMVPTNRPDDWAARGAAGEYDDHARELATNLVNAGLGNSIIRLGHEANGTWKKDLVGKSAKEQKSWAAYWARIAGVMKSVPGASFRFDWTLSAWYRDIPLDRYYPGDEAVDIVGFDYYDTDIDGRQRFLNVDERWKTQFDWAGGPAEIMAFAEQHHKPISIPEWGLMKTAKGGAGDNPTFIENMAALVRDNNVAYQGYWMNDQGDVLTLSADTPKSLAAYKAHFSVGGDAVGD